MELNTQYLALAAIPVATVIIVIAERIISGRGTGARTIQIISAVTFLSVVGMLALADKLDPSTTSALLGAFAGFVFSSLAKFDDR